MTLRKETKTCSCGESFTAYIKVVDGQDELGGFEYCPKCREAKEHEWVKGEVLKALPVLREKGLARWTQDCNLPAKFLSKTFDNFEKSLQPKAFNVMSKFDKKQSIVLLSPNVYGVGKTHLVAALINKTYLVAENTAEVIQTDYLAFSEDGSPVNIRRHRCPVYFTVENVLLSRIRQTYNRNSKYDNTEEYEETEEDVYRQLSQYQLLVIDDVGKVRPKDFGFLQGVYFRIIDHRYSNDMPIILTTNLDYAELENHIGGACADRLREMCESNFVRMTGKSYRQK